MNNLYFNLRVKEFHFGSVIFVIKRGKRRRVHFGILRNFLTSKNVIYRYLLQYYLSQRWHNPSIFSICKHIGYLICTSMHWLVLHMYKNRFPLRLGIVNEGKSLCQYLDWSCWIYSVYSFSTFKWIFGNILWHIPTDLSKTIVYVLNFFILTEVEADQQVTSTLI